MGVQITLKVVNEDKYKKLSDLVKQTHKEKPKPEDKAALRRLFNEDPELW